MKRRSLGLVAGLLVSACAATTPTSVETLAAPPGTPPAAVKALEEGNRLYAVKQWAQARAQYESAIQAAPGLAEAHYNLALTLDRLGDRPAAKKHYLEAANLAPGHRVIWDSWPLRRHGDVVAPPKGDTLLTPSKHPY
ncbi:tetratricopeptide repeat protein [Nitrospira sp. Kam-Ns4a]